MTDAVVFDLDGVLVHSEELWDQARRDLADQTGRPWPDSATRDMMGMSSVEWSRYMHDHVEVPLSPEEINRRVLAQVHDEYQRQVPWIPGAREAVLRMSERWPLGLATSSNREIIDLVVEQGGLPFAATVSSEEVERGKPAPDVYLEATKRLGVEPTSAAAIEDSTNGLLAADAAGMFVVAIPNPGFPPEQRGLDVADVVLESIAQLTPQTIAPR